MLGMKSAIAAFIVMTLAFLESAYAQLPDRLPLDVPEMAEKTYEDLCLSGGYLYLVQVEKP